MRALFRSTRRKLGVLILLMACTAAAGWARSFAFRDQILLPLGEDHFMEIVSSQGFLETNFYWNIPSNAPDPDWQSQPLRLTSARPLYRELGFDERFYWRIQFLGCEAGSLYSVLPACAGFTQTFIALPWIVVALPLTALSTVLILRRPCQNVPVKAGESAVRDRQSVA